MRWTIAPRKHLRRFLAVIWIDCPGRFRLLGAGSQPQHVRLRTLNRAWKYRDSLKRCTPAGSRRHRSHRGWGSPQLVQARGPRHVEVEICYAHRELAVRVRDFGKGMDRSVAHRGRMGHFGLRGMRERAKLIGGKLTIWTRPQAGTEIDLAVPARRAYASIDDSTPSDQPDPGRPFHREHN